MGTVNNMTKERNRRHIKKEEEVSEVDPLINNFIYFNVVFYLFSGTPTYMVDWCGFFYCFGCWCIYLCFLCFLFCVFF